METKLNDGKRVPVLETTAHIVAAYLEKNRIPTNQIAVLIALVSSKLTALFSPVAVVAEQPKPLMNPKKTVSPDFIISLEDGKPYKSLKRHLGLRGLTPVQYREKWGLPADYPMAAPNYSAARSALALKIGLGRKKPAKNRQKVGKNVVDPIRKRLDRARAALVCDARKRSMYKSGRNRTKGAGLTSDSQPRDRSGAIS